MLALSSQSLAGQQTMVTQVSGVLLDFTGVPVRNSHSEVVLGPYGSAAIADNGTFVVRLSRPVPKWSPVRAFVNAPRSGRPWVLYEPRDGQTRIPGGDESMVLSVFAKGDNRILEPTNVGRIIGEEVLAALAAEMRSGRASESTEQLKRRLSDFLGFSSEEVGRSIAQAKESESDNFSQGIVALADGDADAGVQLIGRAIRETKDTLGRMLFALGVANHRIGNYSEAIAAFGEMVRVDPNNPEGFNDLGVLLLEVGQYSRAIDEMGRGIRLVDSLKVSTPTERMTLFGNLATAYAVLGRYREADSVLQVAQALAGSLPARYAGELASVLLERADIANTTYRYGKADFLSQQAIAAAAVVIGAYGRALVVQALVERLEAVEAKAPCFAVDSVLRAIHRLADDSVLSILPVAVLEDLGSLSDTVGKYSVIAVAEARLRTLRAQNGSRHPSVARAALVLSGLVSERRGAQAAESLLIEADGIVAKTIGNRNLAMAGLQLARARASAENDHLEEAESHAALASQIVAETVGKGHPFYGLVLLERAKLAIASDRLERADSLIAGAHELFVAAGGPDDPMGITALYFQAQVAAGRRERDRALRLGLEGFRLSAERLGLNHELTVRIAWFLEGVSGSSVEILPSEVREAAVGDYSSCPWGGR